MDGAVRIKDSADYWFAAVLAYQWLRVIGTRPTSINLDIDDEGTTFTITPFQEFIKALPLDRPINDETIRSIVALVREYNLKHRQNS
jgi:hypothetical protein